MGGVYAQCSAGANNNNMDVNGRHYNDRKE